MAGFSAFEQSSHSELVTPIIFHSNDLTIRASAHMPHVVEPSEALVLSDEK
jgi:hypothetical protein